MMTKRKNFLAMSVTVLAIGMLLVTTGSTSYGRATSTAGTHLSSTHVTTKPSTTRPTISKGISTKTTTKPNTTRSSISGRTKRGILSSRTKSITSIAKSSNLSKSNVNRSITRTVASQMPRTKATSSAINKTKVSTTYRSMNNVSHKADYMTWNIYSYNYYRRPFYHYYAWMPYWMWHSHISVATRVRNEVKQKDMKWIRVNDKSIAVPKKLYNKIKVGDTVELTDDTHIKINGKNYER